MKTVGAIALYMRLSLEDIDKRTNAVKDDSNSINSQRLYLHQYLEQSPSLCGLVRKEFKDDGFTGTNFDRPDFQRMIDMVKRGEISCIIVKDLSRFGRDYLEVGDYLEHVFPFLGVRFISINDHYDSAQHSGSTIGTDIAFKNMIYDYYSKDLSKKVKSSMVMRQRECRLVNSVPYGYKPSPEDKHHLVIDDPAAKIVRKIFMDIISGVTPTDIAKELNNLGVPTPAQYKSVKVRSGYEHQQWTHRTIHTIIGNIKYTGTMVNHTRESRFIRDRNQRRVPKEEWSLRENAHTPIVTMGEYELAHSNIKHRNGYVRFQHDQSDRVYYCGFCGKKLEKANGTVYSCPSKRYHNDSPCKNVYISKVEAESFLLELYVSIRKHEDTKEPGFKSNSLSLLDELTSKIEKIQVALEKLKISKLELYSKYKSGELSTDAFLKTKSDTADNESRMKDQLEGLLKQVDSIRVPTPKENSVELVEPQEVSIEDVYKAIDKVIVKNGTDMHVVWKTQYPFDKATDIGYN